MKTKITHLTVLLLSLIIASCGGGGGGGGSSGKVLIPSAPTELKVTAGNASVSLSWTSSEAKHRVHYATESFAGKSSDYSSASGYGKKEITSGTSVDITGLTNGTQYYFIVTAIKDGKESNASNEVSSTPAKPAVALPSAPTELKATAGNASVSLNWTSSEAKHRIHYATESFAGKGDYSSASGYGKKEITSGTSVDITGLTNGTQYYFVVTAIKDGKESNASNEVSSTPAKPAVALPSAPTELKATAGNASVSLNWTSSEAKHRVHYATESFAGKGDYSSASGYGKKEITSGTSTDITGLTNGTQYYFVVTAIKDGKESNASHEVSSTPREKLLNDTGMIWGGNALGTNNYSGCTSDIAAAQDCHQGRDAQAAAGSLVKKGDGRAGFDFTRLNKDGTEYSGSGDYDQAPWSCVRDNVTGLVWEVKTKSGTADSVADIQAGKSLNIHHKDNLYRWGGITAIGRNHKGRKGDYYDDWNTLVNGSNQENFCGFNDWRVPKHSEFVSLIDHSLIRPSVDTDYFPRSNVVLHWHWMATPLVSDFNKMVRKISLTYGSSYADPRESENRVWLVRGGQ